VVLAVLDTLDKRTIGRDVGQSASDSEAESLTKEDEPKTTRELLGESDQNDWRAIWAATAGADVSGPSFPTPARRTHRRAPMSDL